MATARPEIDVETVPLSDIRPYHRNPRSHQQSAEHVQASIERYGFRIPVILDSDNTIIAGHGRFKAVQRLEGALDERIDELRDAGRGSLADNLSVVNSGSIFAIRETELDSHEISEFRIADNRITELSNWDDNLLQDELERLDADETMPGFTQQEIADLVPDYELEISDDDGPATDPLEDVPEEGSTGVELVCPHCLEEFELDAELVRMELDVLEDDFNE